MSTQIYRNGLWLDPFMPTDRFERRVGDYQLPVRIIDDSRMRPEDGELIHAMAEYTPNSKFRQGDIVYLQRCPGALRLKRELVPRAWKIRWIVSAFAYEINALAHDPSRTEVMGIDHAVALLDAQHGLYEARYRQPMIYAHAFPHGFYPDSATWFVESCFRRITIREKNQVWERVLEEAKAPFYGYDREGLVRPFHLDVAPDNYSGGEALGVPLTSEEATFHTACLLGMEETMVKPVDSWAIGDPDEFDPEHDCFAQHSDS